MRPGREVLLAATSGALRSTDRIVVTGGEDLDPVLRPGFRAVAERAAAGLAQALSGRPRGPGTTTSPGTPVPSGGAARPGDAP